MGNIIEIEKLSKKYKNENGYVDALVDINLNINQYDKYKCLVY